MSRELSSALSRVRRLGRRQPTPAPPPPQDAVPRLQHEPSAEQLQINRKILQDPSSFLDAEARDPLPLGLTPSTRLPSADGGSNTRSLPRPTDLASELISEHDDSSFVDISPRSQSRLAISNIAPGTGWPTFGRKRERRVPDVASLPRHTPALHDPQRTSRSPSPARDSIHLSADSVASTFTLGRLTSTSRLTGRTHEGESSRSTGIRQSASVRSSSKPSSPANTVSSKRHPHTPQRQPCITHSTTPANRERAFDSPHTFGHPTPPNNPAASPSLAPPIPSLPPELTTVVCSRSQPTLSVLRDRSNTFNSNTTRKGDLFASLSLRLERPARFDTAMGEQRENGPGRRRRAQTVSDARARKRRTSADWSAHQAAVGVNAHANQAWPAQVSREILRLSLGEPLPGSSRLHEVRTRGRSADPVHRRDRGVMTPSSFLPFPPSSQPPSTASATPPGQPVFAYPTPRRPLTPVSPQDGRETIPRSHSLRFDLGHRRGVAQPARTTMAEVKRSLSAVEPRHVRANGTGGVAYTPSRLGDPAPIVPQAPLAAPLLHPSSAPTPSQPSPSGRASPTNTPMSSSVQEEPSTPTPAPRHPSDKSRGKRKAEDTIDTTPPEQKKEGQRATFLLPSESRSQRVSNSSHAPSSYHRKRARLSSTSPFATPAQSRPSSVQETPRSATRSHHFASLSSNTGARIAPSRTPSRAASTRSRQPPTPSSIRKHERHQSMSQASIPISAFISPHAPSISRSTRFHMRDPRKPPKKPNDTPWGLRFGTDDEPGSPIQAWCFFIGFLLFPIWWVAGLFLPVPTTRIAGDVDAEKGVTIDDPQIEHDARTWRFRCRVMTVVSLFTYVPFIVLVAVFAPR